MWQKVKCIPTPCSVSGMRLHSRLVLLLATSVVAVSATWPFRSEAPAALAAALPAADATARIVSAAQALMKTLDDSGRAKLQFPFDGPQKTRWSNLPTGIFERKGLRMGDLSAAQRAAVTDLLTAALSRDGYRKVTEIIGGDEALHKANAGPPGGGPPGGNRVIFGEDEYYLAFLGPPSTTSPWMLQFGGHHLAINLTMIGSQTSMTPSLPATQPAKYTVEGREIRPLGRENDKAFALINALDASQRSQAILTYECPTSCSGRATMARRSSRKASARRRSRRRSRRCCSTWSTSGRASSPTPSPRRTWPRSRRHCRRPSSRGAARRRTAAWRISGSRGRRW